MISADLVDYGGLDLLGIVTMPVDDFLLFRELLQVWPSLELRLYEWMIFFNLVDYRRLDLLKIMITQVDDYR